LKNSRGGEDPDNISAIIGDIRANIQRAFPFSVIIVCFAFRGINLLGTVIRFENAKASTPI
jgi:small basic protein